jgi:PleD family two-component response regulator
MQKTALQMDIVDHESFPSEAKLHLVSPVAAPLQSTRLCVLLVEDDDADIYLIRRALANNPRVGEVVVARDGVEALELIDFWATQPDLAIVDLHMPR